MLNITIATGNSAFGDGQRGAELARILRGLANSVERSGSDINGMDLCIRDANGNRVGSLTLEEIDNS